MNYCYNCGTKLNGTEGFCHNCGRKVLINNNNNAGFGDRFAPRTAGEKSKFIAGLLAILFGSMGIHNFYLGYNSKGVAQLLLFVFFLGWVSFIWSIADAIMIFTDRTGTDAFGVPLSDSF